MRSIDILIRTQKLHIIIFEHECLVVLMEDSYSPSSVVCHHQNVDFGGGFWRKLPKCNLLRSLSSREQWKNCLSTSFIVLEMFVTKTVEDNFFENGILFFFELGLPDGKTKLDLSPQFDHSMTHVLQVCWFPGCSKHL